MLLILFGLVGIAIAAPDCNETVANECMKPYTTYFLRRYEGLTSTPEKWKSELINGCEIHQSGQVCLIEFAKNCFPDEPVPANLLSKYTDKDICKLQANTIMKGCAVKNSTWYEKCDRPVLDRLYVYLNLQHEKQIEFVKVMQLRKELCCEMKRYQDCIMPFVSEMCDTDAKGIYQATIDDTFFDYSCNPQILASC